MLLRRHHLLLRPAQPSERNLHLGHRGRRPESGLLRHHSSHGLDRRVPANLVRTVDRHLGCSPCRRRSLSTSGVAHRLADLHDDVHRPLLLDVDGPSGLTGCRTGSAFCRFDLHLLQQQLRRFQLLLQSACRFCQHRQRRTDHWPDSVGHDHLNRDAHRLPLLLDRRQQPSERVLEAAAAAFAVC